MKLVLGAGAFVAILITAGGAQAAQRFAAPEGKGGEPGVFNCVGEGRLRHSGPT